MSGLDNLWPWQTYRQRLLLLGGAKNITLLNLVNPSWWVVAWNFVLKNNIFVYEIETRQNIYTK